MFKKVCSWILIVFGVVVMWISTSRDAMKYLSDKREVNEWWGTYHGATGDLIYLSYLDFVPVFNHTNIPEPIQYPYVNGGNTVLYLNGDSYTWHIFPQYFSQRISGYYYLNRYGTGYYHLDTSKSNILIIEISERLIRGYFSTLRMPYDMLDTIKQVKPLDSEQPNTASKTRFNMGDLFNKRINQNLQFNLFNYQCMALMFKSKAALNYYWFKRASGKVTIADDGKFLFLKETASDTGRASSYSFIDSEDINIVIKNLNLTYDHFISGGFKEIYLSIIPSPATILQPRRYNNLIPMLQNDPRIRMKIIDVYSLFKNDKRLMYEPGDTHWNNLGLQLYSDMISDVIAKNNKPQFTEIKNTAK